MKTSIVKDEWYPVFYIDNAMSYGPILDLPEDLIQRWEKISNEFDQIQRELGNLYYRAKDDDKK